MKPICLTSDIAFILQLYYTHTELTNSDIKALYGVISDPAVRKLKRQAQIKMEEAGIPTWNRYSVDTNLAFEAWHIDVKELERKYVKLKQLNLQKPADA